MRHLSPSEGNITCLRSHDPLVAKQGLEHTTQVLSQHCLHGCISWGPELWKPVSWCLGTGWEALAVKGVAGAADSACHQKGCSLGLSPEGTEFWMQIEQRK